MPPPPRQLAFSHVGFFVKDLARMVDFYTRLLGYIETDRGVARGRRLVFLSRDPAEHHQIVLVEGRTGELSDLVINQISLRASSLQDLRALRQAVSAEPDVTEINPTDHGTAWSLYFRDPERNRLEIFVDAPWYVEQPRVEPLDLSASDDEIMARTLRAIEKHPTFKPIGAWQREFADKIKSVHG
jgi:catechol 2,3-dioxygenase-like lactoylglutathione lyase family enzyme